MKNKLHSELTAWNNGGGETAPSQLDDPDNMLLDARRYEEGQYDCDGETAKARSQAAIDRYCDSDAALQY